VCKNDSRKWPFLKVGDRCPKRKREINQVRKFWRGGRKDFIDTLIGNKKIE